MVSRAYVRTFDRKFVYTGHGWALANAWAPAYPFRSRLSYLAIKLESRSGATIRTGLLRFNGAVERDHAIDAWMKQHAGELGAIARQWFEMMRTCGDEVRELLQDG